LSTRHLSRNPARWVERTLWCCVVVCSSLYAGSLLAHESAPPGAKTQARTQAELTQVRRAFRAGSALFIPSLQMNVPVLSGCSFINLERGACHLEGSATFGGLGNAAVAGHRDKDFRRLEHIQTGMEIFVSDGTQRYRYVVDSLETVSPEDVQVLATHERPELTLITCFPFHYVGSAPRRFIVHAHLVMSSSDPVS
jgi:sortase A